MPEALREVSRHQIERLARNFDALDCDPRIITRDRSIPLSEIGGFLALQAPGAEALSRELRRDGLHTDARGTVLRFGPAPYLSDSQLDSAMDILGAVLNRAVKPGSIRPPQT
jgi:hypothetical protein